MSDLLINQKACPLLLHEGIGGVMNCPGGKCAWWIEDARDCTLPIVAKSIMILIGLKAGKGESNE